jgi:cation:H+ antiporter
LLFIASLAVTLFAARTFARRLDRIGIRFGFPEALIGLLTALAADGPEISSALVALIKGNHGVGVGVLVGSNTFNIAAMLGVSALLAGRVCVSRGTLALEGAVSGAITVIAVVALLGWISPAAAAILAVVVLVPYLVQTFETAEASHAPSQAGRVHSDDPTHHLLGLVVLDVALIVAGSIGMVEAALTLGRDWGISSAVLGTVVLGPLTSIPNAMTGIRLGLASRAEALVGETLNSNTLNLAAGVIVPGLFVTLAAAATATDKLELWWLVGTTVLTLLLLARRRGLGRVGGALLVAAYAGFVAIATTGV